MTTFADRLILARTQCGLSQQELGAAAGVASAQISRYELGKTAPRPLIIQKLASQLKVSFEWLLEGRGAGPGQQVVHDLQDRLVVTDAIEDVEPLRAYTLRLQPSLYDRLVVAAEEAGRILGEEIRQRLQSTFDAPALAPISMDEIYALEAALDAAITHKRMIEVQAHSLRATIVVVQRDRAADDPTVVSLEQEFEQINKDGLAVAGRVAKLLEELRNVDARIEATGAQLQRRHEDIFGKRAGREFARMLKAAQRKAAAERESPPVKGVLESAADPPAPVQQRQGPGILNSALEEPARKRAPKK